MTAGQPIWLFAYGSLIWRPDFPFLAQTLAMASGWQRRFWQGSHDHRGTESAPGRVVTLVPQGNSVCIGVAYRLDPDVLATTFKKLDHREKNGYERGNVKLQTPHLGSIEAIVYRAAVGNPAWLGPAPLADVAAQIASSTGPSGSNAEYLFGLADALRARAIEDDHVFALEALVKPLSEAGGEIPG